MRLCPPKDTDSLLGRRWLDLAMPAQGLTLDRKASSGFRGC